MIITIEALNYRCLRYIKQTMGSFQVLVGPNASGKTTFLDVVTFLGRFVSVGVETAVGERTHNFQDLLWQRRGQSFELSIESKIPENILAKLPKGEYDRIRYEVAIGLSSTTNEISILAEKVLLKSDSVNLPEISQGLLFPLPTEIPHSIMTFKGTKNTRLIVNKEPGGNDNYYDETGGSWNPSFRLGPRKSALNNLPYDESKFPTATWFKDYLQEGIQQFILNSLLIRKASPPDQIRGFKTDGSNLPWIISTLHDYSPQQFSCWITHLQTALPDLDTICVVEQEDDRHRYLVLCYKNGLNVPSWMASDGTLRLLALTLPAYLTDFHGVYLIEEPENGIHPRAVETMFQSLLSVYDAQILVATHSPVILSLVKSEDVLCFSKTTNGATNVIRGSEHPALKEWRGETTLGNLFAGGVLD